MLVLVLLVLVLVEDCAVVMLVKAFVLVGFEAFLPCVVLVCMDGVLLWIDDTFYYCWLKYEFLVDPSYL